MHVNFLIQLQQLHLKKPTKIEDPNLPSLLVEFSDAFAKLTNLPPTRSHDHRKFMDDDKISAPLMTLLKKKKDTFLWPNKAIAAFDALTSTIPYTPVLALLDTDKVFAIKSNALGVKIVVLMQGG
ncbi:hypothetical protein GW17_00038151 [Ensete ventricosum]|nr:hypothetical protein GW17_00038151 [Ensete ventricosum]